MPITAPTRHPALTDGDPEIAELVRAEERLQADTLRLIPSENYVSAAVLEATGSVLTNKYSEGYPGRRYYEGQQAVDPIEELARHRARALFRAEHANVQPYSGSPANLAVYLAFAKPGDPVLGLSLPMGGHLTHGWDVSVTGKWFRASSYGVRRDTGRIDFDEVRSIALHERPRIIFCGGTALPRTVDFAAFAEIAREVGAVLAADISHIAGLVAAGVHPSPIGHADVVSTTTHKTLRGPRGAMLLCGAEHAKTVDKAVFPGLQGGPHNHTTAAIAVALREAAAPEFRMYAQAVVANARRLGEELAARGYDLVSGGTDTHLLLIDLTSRGVPGKLAAQALDRAGIVVNHNTVPFDPRRPFDPSGIRVGTPALTSRGLTESHMSQVAVWIDRVVQSVRAGRPEVERQVRQEVAELMEAHPAPGLPI